jgi:hypothetical protein
MNRAKVISTLEQIKALADGALSEINGAAREGKSRKIETPKPKPPGLSFNTNILAFMKSHAAGLSGPKKFTLLLARMTKGNTSQEVPFAELEKQWNKMKVVLAGRFNGAYANRAKANGWVDSPKFRTYTLSDSWKECLSNR